MKAADRLKAITPIPLQRSVARRRVNLRRTSQAGRTLPDFLVIGAQRCGTSSLYKYLGWHPEIVPSLRKEVEYFTRSYGKGIGWYRAHFPLRVRRDVAHRVLHREILTFEATPDYLLHPLAAQRAAELLPDAKLIVLLRDPVSRAFSHYLHMCRRGFENLGFDQAIEKETQRIAGDLRGIHADPAYDPKQYLRFSYSARGLYAEQIERWMARYPPDRLLILASGDLYRDPSSTYARVLEFLGVHSWSPKSFPTFTEARQGLSDSQTLAPHMREMLVERFREPNQALFRLIGTDLGWAT